MPKKQSKAAPDKVEHEERVREALQLRRSGMHYEDIAIAQGVNVSTAWRRVRSGLAALAKVNLKEAEFVRDIEIARLDFYLEKLDDGIRAGDVKAIGAAINVAGRRARLMGIDAKSDEAAALETIGKEIGALARSVLGDEAADKLTEALARDT